MKISRLESLRDGIFSIVMTLLVLDLKIPLIKTPDLDAKLISHLLALIPNLLSYIVSFIIIGILWIGHHNQMHFIERTDRNFLWINILFFLTISFLPFSAALLGAYPLRTISIIIYAANLILTELLLLAVWQYAVKNKFTTNEVTIELNKIVTIRILTLPFFYALAIPVSFLNPVASLCLFVIPLFIVIFPGKVDKWLK